MPHPGRPALFLDRDGVINEEIGYLYRFEDVRFVLDIVGLIRAANRLQMPVIVVTNQAGIGRGLYTEAQFHALMRSMRDGLAAEGAYLHAIYFSPFHPEHGLGEYQRETECRKPRPGMLFRAAADHGLDLAASVIVGDRCSDIEAGGNAGVPHRFLLRGTELDSCANVDYTSVEDLATVTRWLQQQYRHLDPATEAPRAGDGNAHAVPA